MDGRKDVDFVREPSWCCSCWSLVQEAPGSPMKITALQCRAPLRRIRCRRKVIAVPLRRGWTASEPSPKKLPSLHMPIVASLPSGKEISPVGLARKFTAAFAATRSRSPASLLNPLLSLYKSDHLLKPLIGTVDESGSDRNRSPTYGHFSVYKSFKENSKWQTTRITKPQRNTIMRPKHIAPQQNSTTRATNKMLSTNPKRHSNVPRRPTHAPPRPTKSRKTRLE